MNKKITLCLLIIIVISGCSTLKNNFSQEGQYYRDAQFFITNGNYITALENLTYALKLDPNYIEAEKLYNNNLQNFLNQVENIENTLSLENAIFKNEGIFNLYSKAYNIVSSYNNSINNSHINYLSDKLNIYREKATIEYYQAGVEDSLVIEISRDNKCFDYFKNANRIWGSTYLDTDRIASSVLYRKAQLFISLKTRASYLKAIYYLKKIEEWSSGYKDSKELIIKLSKDSTAYFLILGNEKIATTLEAKIGQSIKNSANNILNIPKSRSQRYKLNKEDLSKIKIDVDTIFKVTLKDIEHIPLVREAQFNVESKSYWVNNNTPIQLASSESIERWHNAEKYRVKLLEDGITGYKDFIHTYIKNRKETSISAIVEIEAYSNNLKASIGKKEVKIEYVDFKEWVSSKSGDKELFNNYKEDTLVVGILKTKEELIDSAINNMKLDNIIGYCIELILEDNPLDQAIRN